MKIPARWKTLRLLVGAACLVACTCGPWRISTAQEALAARESRGRQIYVQGTSPSGKAILAYIGEQSLEIPASAIPCANCHGLDGQGKSEGGINPSNVTWEALTKPYGSTQAYGRKHPPYTDRGIELALTRGLDPAGNKLLDVMPRYAMSREDIADLILYLARLGKDRDPGINENSIVIATVLPDKGALAEMGQAIKAVTAAVFEDVNAAGGIYNRRLELKVAEVAETPVATRLNVERLLTAEPVFAVTGAFIAGSENEVLPVLSQRELPLIGPFTLYPKTSLPLDRRVFYLLSGLDDQARALVEFAARKPEVRNAGIAVVHPQGENSNVVLEAIQRQSKKAGLPEPKSLGYVSDRFDSAGIAKQVRQAKRESVFLLGNSEEALSFMREAEKLGWFPFILLSNSIAVSEVFSAPAGFDGRVFIAFPTSPADQTVDGIKEFRAFAARHQLPARHLATQILAYTAARILVDGLKRAGKDLSREKLIQALEGLYEYQTGLTPAITYGPNRRIGAMGAHVITINLKEKQFAAASGWISLDK